MKPIRVEDIKRSYKISPIGIKPIDLVRKHLLKSDDISIEALRGVSFEVDKGEIFGIIGADGAGKTTLFRILSTLLLADSGKAFIDGFDVIKDYQSIRKRVGYMPGRFSLYQDLSVEENINFFAKVFNTSLKENYHLVEDIYKQIEPFKKRHAGALSGGMKQKLALSCALIHKPSVLFLDEPTTGVDPVSRKEFWAMLKKLKNEGITILVSTPYMDEASLCDRVALIQEGIFMDIDTPNNIVSKFNKELWKASSDNMPKLLKDLREFYSIQSAFAFGDSHHFTVDKSNFNKSELESILLELDYKNLEIEIINPTIEDCFMELAKQNSKK